MEEINSTLDAIKPPLQQMGVGFSNLRTALKEADLDNSGRIDRPDEFYYLIQRSPSILGYLVSIGASGYLIYGTIKRVLGQEFDIMALIVVGLILIMAMLFTIYIKKVGQTQNKLLETTNKYFYDLTDKKNKAIEQLKDSLEAAQLENTQLRAILTVKDSAVKAYQTLHKDIPVPNVAESEYFPKLPKKNIPIRDSNGNLIAEFVDGEIILKGGLKSPEVKETQNSG